MQTSSQRTPGRLHAPGTRCRRRRSAGALRSAQSGCAQKQPAAPTPAHRRIRAAGGGAQPYLRALDALLGLNEKWACLRRWVRVAAALRGVMPWDLSRLPRRRRAWGVAATCARRTVRQELKALPLIFNTKLEQCARVSGLVRAIRNAAKLPLPVPRRRELLQRGARRHV